MKSVTIRNNQTKERADIRAVSSLSSEPGRRIMYRWFHCVTYRQAGHSSCLAGIVQGLWLGPKGINDVIPD
jgi:hypothetical protein